MTIQKEISRQEHSSVKLTVTVAKDDVRSQYDEILGNYSKNLLLPGFRRGKVPREVLLRKFGDALKAEAMGSIIEKSITEVFGDKDAPKEDVPRPLPFVTPQLEGKPELDPENDFSFSIAYDVFPTVNINTWKGFEIEVPLVEISDEDVNRELEKIQERNAIVVDCGEGTRAEIGNIVTVDYCEIDDKGEIVHGTERQDYVFTLGTGNNIYRFDSDIRGMKTGETREFEKIPPAEQDSPGAVEKRVKLRVSLTALKERKLPDIDDDLAQDVDEKFHSLEELKNNIRDSLNRNLEQQLHGVKISRLLEQIAAASPVDIPESMIRFEVETRWRQLARNYDTTVENLKKNIENDGRDPESIQYTWRPGVIMALHSRLIVESLIKEFKLEAGDEDMEQEMQNMAAGEKDRLETIKKYYEQEQTKEQLREEIKERKLFDILFAENTIKPGKKENYLDLMSNNG
ncbi:MAG: trigger factor [Treponema sp.]|nr:trigger factor [Treponema sp.]